MLYFSPREYVVLFGTPTGTQGFSGRYKRVEIHKFLMAGQIESFELENDDLTPIILRPGDAPGFWTRDTSADSRFIRARGISGRRGPVVTTLPFATIETLFVSLEFQCMRLAASEFARMVRQQMGRSRAR